MYFLAENIAFNHNDVVEIVCILGWIYYSICDGESENGFSEKKEEIRWPEWLLVCVFGVLIEGPTIYMNYSLNVYIVIKLMMKRINQSWSIWQSLSIIWYCDKVQILLNIINYKRFRFWIFMSYQYKKSTILYELEQAIKRKVIEKSKHRDPSTKVLQSSIDRKKNQRQSVDRPSSKPK